MRSQHSYSTVLTKRREAQSTSYLSSGDLDDFPGRRVVQTTIHVPQEHVHRIPDVLHYRAPSIVEHPVRHRRVPLVNPSGLLVRKKVNLVVPKALPQVAPHYVAVRSGNVVVHSARSRARLLYRERNRKRRSERKGQRKRYWHGHLASLRSDRYGLVGAALRARSDVRQLHHAALVARALGG